MMLSSGKNQALRLEQEQILSPGVLQLQPPVPLGVLSVDSFCSSQSIQPECSAGFSLPPQLLKRRELPRQNPRVLLPH